MGNFKISKKNDDRSSQHGIVASTSTANHPLMRSTQREHEIKVQSTTLIHMPAGVLAKIVSYVSAEGPNSLINWIRAGPEGKAAVYSKETLSRVSFYGHPLYMLWSKDNSSYFNFFSKCLEHKNPQAVYVECIRLGFCAGDLDGAINISRTIKDVFPTAALLHIMLSSFTGVWDLDAFSKFKSEHNVLEDVQDIGECLLFDVKMMEPRRADTYGDSWRCQYIPQCILDHNWFLEDNGERCLLCIHFQLSMELCMLT